MKYNKKYNLESRLLKEWEAGNEWAQKGDQAAQDIAAKHGLTKQAGIGQSSADAVDSDGNEVEIKSTTSGTISVEITHSKHAELRKSIYVRAAEIEIEREQQGMPPGNEQGQAGWGAKGAAVRELVSDSQADAIVDAFFEANGGKIYGSDGEITRQDVQVASHKGGGYGGDKNRSAIVVNIRPQG